jgi:hypothetical protein
MGKIAASTSRKAWNTSVAAWSRWLHIYLSMFSFIIVLFFAITGLTLNHVDWFPEQTSVREIDAKLNLSWVNQSDTAKIPKLTIVEYFRATHGIKGLLNDFRIDDRECSISFQGPGYTSDIFISREDGAYHLTETNMGIVAVMNDLHKGRDTGQGWSWIIDFSAIFMSLVSLTGLTLLLFIKKRRGNGLIVALIGVIAVGMMYWLW